MIKSNITKIFMLLTFLLGGMSTALADDRLYIEAVNIEPLETAKLTFNLDNTQTAYGFQAEIVVPAGLELRACMSGEADISLSGRFNNSFSVVSNLLSSTDLRLGAFSVSHSAIDGNSGALFSVTVTAKDDFQGGTLTIKDAHLIGENDIDIALQDLSVEIGAVHYNGLYVDDLNIAHGETKALFISLDNEIAFTALQTDVILPECLHAIEDSFSLTNRASNSHSVSVKEFADGRIRLIVFSPDNKPLTGNNGNLISFHVVADNESQGPVEIAARNTVCSTVDGREYFLPDALSLVQFESGAQNIIPTLTAFEVNGLYVKVHSSSADLYDIFGKPVEVISQSSHTFLFQAHAPGLYLLKTAEQTRKIFLKE